MKLAGINLHRNRKKWNKLNIWSQRAGHLNRDARVKFLTPQDLRLIWADSGGKCFYCSAALTEERRTNGMALRVNQITFDHVIPRLHDKNNLVLAYGAYVALQNS